VKQRNGEKMLLLLATIPLAFVLLYLLRQRRDDTWEQYLQRKRERPGPTRQEQPIDPTFQFEETPPE